MQKKFIVLAIAAAASAGAFAQSNVQIYGLVDYGVTARFKKLSGDYMSQRNYVRQAYDNRDSSRFTIDSGQSAGNRLGFKGVEDLGNGLKAIFVLERGFSLDTGADASSNAEGSSGFNRQAYLGLTGNFGTVAGGRLYIPHYTFLTSLDPFNGGTVGRYNNTYRLNRNIPTGQGCTLTDVANTCDNAVGILDEVLEPIRVDNALTYISPNFSGFTLTGLFSNNSFGNNPFGDDDRAGTKDSNTRVYALLGQYANGPLALGLSLHTFDSKPLSNGQAYFFGNYNPAIGIIGQSVGVKKVDNWVLGGSYDFSSVKLSGFVGQTRVKLDTAVPNVSVEALKMTNVMIGVTVPLGSHAIKGSVNYSKAKQKSLNPSNGKAWQFAVGYDYNLSKRTTFYSAASYIKNDDPTVNALGQSFGGRASVVGDSSNDGGIYKTGVQVGIRYSF